MLAALRSAVAAVSSELAEKNAVIRVLAEHGHRRPPSVVQHRDASGVTRVYLWDDAGIALVTGPSLEGTVYEVHAVPADADPTAFDVFIPAARGRSAFAAGRKAKALANPAPARAPLAQAPRRVGAHSPPQPPVRQPAVLTRHNPPDAYEVNPGLPGGKQTLGDIVPFADIAVGTILFRIVNGNEVGIEQVTSKSMAGPYANMKIKNLAKTMKIGGGRVLIATTAAPTQGMHAAEDLTATTFYGSKTKPTQAWELAHKYLPMIGIDPAAQPLLMAYGSDEFRTLPMPSGAVAPAAPSSGTPIPASAAAQPVYVVFEPGTGILVSGGTKPYKDAIKAQGFKWSGPSGYLTYPPNVWFYPHSDVAKSVGSFLGGKSVLVIAANLASALKAAGATVQLSSALNTDAVAPVAAPAAASGDPSPPPMSPLPAVGIPVQFSSDRFRALPPNPVWAEGGGVDAIAKRLKLTGGKPGGGLAGGVYTDSQTGLTYLAKFPPNAQMVASEVLAAHLYRALGVFVPDMRPAVVDGKATILSPWIAGLKPLATSGATFAANVPLMEKKWLAASFPSDVWLADYDVVGLSWDNLLKLPDGHSVRIDPGASLMFRAGGQLKSPLPTVNADAELDSMLFQPINDKTPVVFALAKDDPALMVPMATAIAVYMQQPYIDALANWTGYSLKAGIPFGMTIGDYLYNRAQSVLEAVLAKAGTTAPAPAAAPVSTPAPAPAPTVAPLAVAESVAKKVAALLPGTSSGGVGPFVWTVMSSVGTYVELAIKYDSLVATIFANDGTPKQQLSYDIPSGSLTSFIVSRAADIANAFKPYLAGAAPAAASTPTLPVPTASAGAGLADVSSMTEIDALPEGSIVTGAASPGALLYVRDASGLWRELTDDGGFMPGLFSDDVYDTLGGEVLLVYEGNGTGPEADDAIMLSAYYSMAQQILSGKKPAPAAAPAPAPVAAPPAAAAAPSGDPLSWPVLDGFEAGMGPDFTWDAVGGVAALVKRLEHAPLGPKLGSFYGGKMVDPLTGAAFYVKFFKNAEHADTEALASHLYRLLGINAPDARVAGALWFGAKGKGFQRALLSPWESGYEQRVNGSFTSDEKAVLRSQFPADVWMSNYDVVGKGPATKYDNLLVNLGSPVAAASHFLRVDQGAALDYRSTGSAKKSSSEWDSDAAKTWGGFLSSQHPTIFKVFDGATPTNGAAMIQRIGKLVGHPQFGAVLGYAKRGDLSEMLKARAGWLAGMLSAETSTAAPAVSMPSAGPTALYVGMKAAATMLKPLIKQGKWSLLKKDDDTLYLAGFGDGKVNKIDSMGWSGDVLLLPPGGYTVLAVGGDLGNTEPKVLHAQYSPPTIPAAAATPTFKFVSPNAVEALAEQVRQTVASKGFATSKPPSVITHFVVTLYEGTEAHAFSVKFIGQFEKVVVKLNLDEIGLFSPDKAGVADAIATAILGALRLKMANFGLMKQPPGAAPVASAGSVTVGTILTTVEQIKALPVGSVIAYGHNTGPNTTPYVSLYRCVDSDEWMLTTFSGELKTGTNITTSEMAPSTEQWGVVVLRVGGEGDLPEAFYEHLIDVTGKSAKSILSSFPLGA